MEHESPIMKAWREFALADPEDCDREWEAYLALVSGKETASVSPPTNTTSSLHSRVHGPAVVSASSATRSTASLHAPSNAMSSTAVSEESASRWDQDNVYPPLADLRRALMTDAEWAAMSEWEKDLWEMKHLPEEERMKSIEGVVMWLPAAQQDQRRKEILEEILRFGEPAPTLYSSRAPASTTDTSLVLPVAIELDVVQDAVDDQAAPTPTNCSSECPSKDAPAPVSVIIPSTTSNSSTTICDVVSEQAALAVSDKAIDVDAMGDTTPSTAVCLPAGPGHNICGKDLVPKPLTVWSAPTSFSLLPGNPPSSTREPMDVLEPFMWSSTSCSTIRSERTLDTPPSLLPETYMKFSIGPNVSTMAPWPPPSCTRARPPLIRGQNLFQHAQQKHGKEFSVMDSKGNWIAIWLDVELKPPWPFIGVCINLPMGWIYNRILRGNTHYSEQMQWSFSHSLLQFQFCTAFVQSENFWEINHVPLKSWFQCCCCAQRKSIYSCEKFQWAIAWSLRCPFFQSICPPWKDGLLPCSTQRMFSCITAVTRCLLGASILASSVLILTGINSISTHYFKVHIRDPIAVRLSGSSAVTCLQGSSIRELFSCSFVVELIKKGMVALEELQPWAYWERPLLVTTLYYDPPPAKPPDKMHAR